MSNYVLDMQTVKKSFHTSNETITAVHDVSLQLRSGEFVAIQGPSGCGKSTLMMIAGGLLSPDEGRIALAGNDLYSLSPPQRDRLRASHIGFVFQQFHLIPYLSVYQNILSPSVAQKSSNAEKRTQELIDRFGLSHRRTHLPSQLSTGERQRTALGRALLNSPQIILADEPTGNLDDENTFSVLDYMTQFTANGGTVLMVTHDCRAAEKADRSIHMENGYIHHLETSSV